MSWLGFSLPWILFLATVRLSKGDLDLYMNVTETKRLLGIDSELAYIRNGNPNTYALNFVMPLNTDVQRIYFTWKNLRKNDGSGRKNDGSMFYHMEIEVKNTRAMNPPRLSIPNEGIVPTKTSTFYVDIPCSGRMTAEVNFIIRLNVNIYSVGNITSVNIQRKKFCHKINGHRFSEDGLPTDHNQYKHPNYTMSEKGERTGAVPSGSDSTYIFYIAVGCACGLILLIAIVVSIYYVRSQKVTSDRMRSYPRPAPPKMYPAYLRKSDTSSSQALSHSGHTYLRAETPSNSVTGMTSLKRMIPVVEMKPAEVRASLNLIHIDRKRITLGDVLMEGTFGRIFHGTLLNEDTNEINASQDILVKTVTDQARPDQIETLMRESHMMKGLAHANVNHLVAMTMDNETTPLLIYPFAYEGNLKKFLQRCKMSEMTSHAALNTQQLVYMAVQIVRGLQYLHRKRILHKDVAARNCVVDQQLTCRITDSGLSRDLFPNDYHCLGDNENRPIKWMAIETLVERTHLPTSDVWSFGVLLWELMTLGQQPYADVDPFEMARYLKEGFRIAQPFNCPDELFGVMACCWALNPDERPRFSQLLVGLQDFYTALTRYI